MFDDIETKRRFASQMVGCAEYYGQGEKMSKGVLALWFDQLKAYSLEQVGAALTAHMRDHVAGRFMPKVADLLRYIEGDPDELAAQAWATARQAIGRVGHWQSVAFDDPAIAETIIEIGGWQRLCSLEQDEMVWAEKEFRSRFASAKSRGVQPQHSGVILGITDTQNIANGLLEHVSKPIPVGRDIARAIANAEAARGALTHKTAGAVPLAHLLKGIEERTTS